MDVREPFKYNLYDEKISGKEFELITLKSFADICKAYFKLSEKHIKAISILLSDHFIGEAFDFNFFIEIFK